MEIEQKLDLLAEFHAQKDLLELDKSKLLDEVKIPAEIEIVVSNGMKQASELEAKTRAAINAFNADVDKEIAEIVVPEEFKIALAEIDRQRTELMAKFTDIEKQRQAIVAKKRENENIATEALVIQKRALQAEIEQQTKDVYAQIAQRKLEIEAEFSGKSEDVDENIKKLEAEIKDDMKKHVVEKLKENPKCKDLGVKGKFFHAIYGKPRKIWIPAKLDDLHRNPL